MSYLDSYFGTSTESEVLTKHLQEKGGHVEVAELFSELGLDSLSGNYTNTTIDGFGDAFMVVAALAVLMVEKGEIKLHVDSKEKNQISTALKYFALSPDEHAVADRCDDLYEVADLAEEIRGKMD